mgnify:FL=1
MAKSYKDLFQKYQDSRTLEKARRYSQWTIPSLMAQVDLDGRSTPLEGDFQSDGALLVNGLASKLTDLLFPTTHPFLRIQMTREDRAVLEENLGASTTEVESYLAELETNASQRVFLNSSYNQLNLGMKHLIVTGNVAVYRDSALSRTITYGLERFALKRDGLGFVVDAVIKDHTYFGSLPEDIQAILLDKRPTAGRNMYEYESALEMYTRVRRERREGGWGYAVTVQIDNIDIPPLDGWYRERTCPWIFPVMNLVTGENYGRGLVEDHAGSFAKLSEVSFAATLYAIESCKVVNLVGPDSQNSIEELEVAAHGEYVRATPSSVPAHETGSTQKLSTIYADLETTFSRLARAFMYTGNTRSGERVTAYEIRQQALEVEASQGGVYSSLSESLQLPLAYLLLAEIDPEIAYAIAGDDDAPRININTGINAIGRATEVQNILRALVEGQQAVELATAADKRIDPAKLMDKILAGYSVIKDEIFKTDEQLEAEAQAEQAMAEAQSAMQQAEGAAAMLGELDPSLGM